MGIIYIQSPTGAKLTIQACTTVKLAADTDMEIAYGTDTYGTLIADGASDNKITFTSAAPAGSENPGDWYGIFFWGGTGAQTILDNCIISYGGGWSSSSGNLNVSECAAGVPTISNCLISYSENWGIYVEPDSSPILSGNT